MLEDLPIIIKAFRVVGFKANLADLDVMIKGEK